MRLKFEIKPYAIIEGKGTTQDALRRLYGDWGISAMPTTFTNHGNFSHRLFDYKNAWFYTMQVYKRGKYRHNKHYEVRIYKVPMDILEYMKVKIYQNRGWVKIDKMIDGKWKTIK